MMDLQNDIKSLAAERFLRAVLPDVENTTDPKIRRAVELLKSWNYENPPESVPAMLYHAWWKFAAEETFRDEMGNDITAEYLGLWSLSLDRFLKMLDESDNVWFDDVATPQRETRRDISRRGLTEAIAWLTKELSPDMNSWEWGRMHVVRLHHWFDPRVKLFNVGPIPYGGDGETPQRAGFEWKNPFETSETAVLRVITDFSDTDHIWAIIPSGQSGWWLNRNYSDQWPIWTTGGYLRIPMNEDEIKSSCPYVLTLKP
jgi:penicillin amidase